MNTDRNNTLTRRLRQSFRRVVKPTIKHTSNSSPSSCPSLRISYHEVELTVSSSKFRPHHLRIVYRHYDRYDSRRFTIKSDPVSWEPALKSPLTGFCVWHPPFEFDERRSNNNEYVDDDDDEEEDAFFTLENTDSKGKRKELAKIRFSWKEWNQHKEPNLRLKLRPCSQKVSHCFFNLTIESHNDVKDESVSLVSKDDDNNQVITNNNDSLSTSSSYQHHRHFSSRPVSPSLVSLTSKLNESIGSQDTKKPEFNDPKEEEEEKETETETETETKTKTKTKTTTTTIKREVNDLKKTTKKVVSTTAEALRKKKNESINAALAIFDDDDDDDKDDDDDDDNDGNKVSLVVIPSSPSSPSSLPSSTRLKPEPDDSEILEWAKSKLIHSNRIKITNLTSSWRNGVGFCCLIHQNYPELIPISKLENHNHESNRRLAFEAASLLGISTEILNSKFGLGDDGTKKHKISHFLRELKRILDDVKPILDPQTIRQWQKERYIWFPEVSNPILNEQQQQQQEEEDVGQAAAAAAAAADGVVPKETVPLRPKESPPSVETSALRQSVILLNHELSVLSKEEERIAKAKNELEIQFRQELSSNNSIEDSKLQRWIELVNAKNSVVRRQMQLNIREKESMINVKLEKIQKRLHELAEIEDSMKTEVIRDEEQALLSQLVEAVNEKNELVHHMDNQEKAIDDDEMIQTFLRNPNSLKAGEECVIQ